MANIVTQVEIERDIARQTQKNNEDFSLKRFYEILEELKLNENDFEFPWQKDAIIYRALILAFAEVYVKWDESLSFDVTWSEYLKDTASEQIKSLHICLEINKDWEWEDVEPVWYAEFADLLKTHLNLIPSELSSKIDMYISYNLGDKWGIEIKSGQVKPFSDHELKEVWTDNAWEIWFTDKYKIERTFRNTVYNKIDWHLRLLELQKQTKDKAMIWIQ
ncbi:MAG: hypothetical protein ACD_3C00101G0001 [uncultured bacterium (gcode 4)]|uniref:Uncharacterized protein n=1 Tax=uncultured bacterium (gcode 4) TaxID=1234023 RepID=K2GXH1_9BACT|nr:MAG: hypothetical protein ACD_3C00101G0001 [uncultured bacterium (gcode 4)]